MSFARITLLTALVALTGAAPAGAQSDAGSRLVEAAEALRAFTADDADAIPLDLLRRAHGIAVIPGVIRGGFIVGARRGRGALAVRTADGHWSNPAFVTLTGGSIGWQFGAESADIVLVFANERSIANIYSGKFTLGGDASAIAGPLGRHATMAVTFRAEVYGYIRSRGLFAGASFEGTRLAIDHDRNRAFYAQTGNRALGPQEAGTPQAARRLLLALTEAALPQTRPDSAPPPARAEDAPARTFPLDGAR